MRQQIRRCVNANVNKNINYRYWGISSLTALQVKDLNNLQEEEVEITLKIAVAFSHFMVYHCGLKLSY